VSLAATFDVKLIEIQEEQNGSMLDISMLLNSFYRYGLLFAGLAIVSAAIMSESGSLPGPQSDVFAVINIIEAVIGVLAIVLGLTSTIRYGQYIGATLAVLGTPLVMLFAAGATMALIDGRPLSWLLVVFGSAGIVLLVMAVREFRRGNLLVQA
jgi:hypothetical protein